MVSLNSNAADARELYSDRFLDLIQTQFIDDPPHTDFWLEISRCIPLNDIVRHCNGLIIGQLFRNNIPEALLGAAGTADVDLPAIRKSQQAHLLETRGITGVLAAGLITSRLRAASTRAARSRRTGAG